MRVPSIKMRSSVSFAGNDRVTMRPNTAITLRMDESTEMERTLVPGPVPSLRVQDRFGSI